MPITHTDGKEYFSNAEVEDVVKNRVKTVQETAASWEQKYKTAEPELAKVSTLVAERDAARTEAAKAVGGLTRFKATASHGITDSETQWALEQAHSRAMEAVPEANRATYEAWLGQVKADPNLAPPYLRGVFVAPAAAGAAAGAGTAAPVVGAAAAGQPAAGVAGTPAGVAAPVAAARPPWASAAAGQTVVQPGLTPDFAARVAGAKTLDDLAKLSAERRGR